MWKINKKNNVTDPGSYVKRICTLKNKDIKDNRHQEDHSKNKRENKTNVK